MSLGPGELVVILLVVVLLFGSRRLAALGKGIGEGIREFKRGISGSGGALGKRDVDAVGGAIPPTAGRDSGQSSPQSPPTDPQSPG